MLKEHVWACPLCLQVCPARCVSEALHTPTLFGLAIGTFGSCLGGRDWERVRLALAAARREQTCRGFGHGGGEWRDACAATCVYGSCLDHVLWSVRAELANAEERQPSAISTGASVILVHSSINPQHRRRPNPSLYLHIMSPSALSALLAVAAASVVLAQPDPADPTPLYDKYYDYPNGIVSPSSIRPHFYSSVR